MGTKKFTQRWIFPQQNEKNHAEMKGGMGIFLATTQTSREDGQFHTGMKIHNSWKIQHMEISNRNGDNFITTEKFGQGRKKCKKRPAACD